MNSQLDRTKAGQTTTGYGDDHHNVALHHTGGGHDEGEDHGEKKSVLKKVKAKAKKIKDTITGHGHGHDDDDDDDEMDIDPDIHGAPAESDKTLVAAHGIGVGKEGITKHHGTNIGEIGSHAPVTHPGSHQVFDPTSTHYVPGQEETLGWSRTDIGTQLGSGKPHGTNIGGKTATGDHAAVTNPGPYQVFDPTTTHYVPGQEETLCWSRTDTGTPIGSECPPSALKHTPGIGHSSGTHSTGDLGFCPGDLGFVQKPKYIPGQDETLGWSRTDTGSRRTFSEEQPYAPKNTPAVAHPGHQRGGVLETAKHGEIFDRPTHLEKDPHAPRDVGEKRHAENYQTKVADPTGRGSEEIGVTHILHQLGKMNINDDSNVKATGQQEHPFVPSSDQHQMASTGSHEQFSPEMASAGSHDQFSSEPVPNPQFDSTRARGYGFHDEVGQRPESYTEKISFVASELASKAKLATGSVTSKLGYGGSRETPTKTDSDVPGGYEESLSSISSPITDSKSGYGVGEEQSTVGSVGDYGKKVVSTVQEKIAPVYETVAGLGSTVVSKVQGAGEAGSTGGVPDKGVSVKEYLAEKLKPGEEDKALSKVITEALPLHKPKENPSDVQYRDEGRNVEIQKQVMESDQAKKVVITGRVTESEEVANRLGRSEDVNYDGAGLGLASPRKSVMDRIRDAAGSWFNTSGEPRNEADDHGEQGTEKTQTSIAREPQPNQIVGETGLQ